MARKDAACRLPLWMTVLCVSFSCSTAMAESVLQVLPTRIVMEGPKRADTITLINRGDSDGTYRIFFRNLRASEEGRLAEVTEAIAGERFADRMVRFSPRRITVPARSKQSVRVLVRKPADIEAGEYRSHMVFRKMPGDSAASESDQLDDSNIGFSLKPIVEVTIPVIVRHGDVSATVSL